MKRRTFLKIAGMSGFSIAAGCDSRPAKNLFSQVHAPEDQVTGMPTWYASTCRECPAGCGVLAKNEGGRVIKVEGNPLHPINRGKLCMRGQAALQGIFNPDRIKTPLLREKNEWRPISFSSAQVLLKEKADSAARKGKNRVRILTEVVGEGLLGLFRETLTQWNSDSLRIFEPYAYESLKTANDEIFGVDGLVSYRMEESDLLVSFGADFLETWLSPVEYAEKFKGMHAVNDGKKGLFIHVGPFQSLTGANADLWASCSPGTEAIIALGLIHETLKSGKGGELPEATRALIEKVTSPYGKERVVRDSGLDVEVYERIISRLFQASRALVLGTGTGGGGGLGLQTNMAANLLNLVLDPGLSRIDFTNRHRVEQAARRSEILDFFTRLETEPVDLLLLNNVNPLFSLNDAGSAKSALEKEALFVVSFSNFMDETTSLADLILPVSLPLETWDEYGGWSSIVSTLQPTMGNLYGGPHLGDILLDVAWGRDKPVENYQTYLKSLLQRSEKIRGEKDWLKILQSGGVFDVPAKTSPYRPEKISNRFEILFSPAPERDKSGHIFLAAPSIRFFDGRDANRPWLCEIPAPLTRVAWHTPVLLHSETLAKIKVKQGDVISIRSRWGQLEAPVYETESVVPDLLVMDIGQGHTAFGRYAKDMGLNPYMILSPQTEPHSGGPRFMANGVTVNKTSHAMKLAHTDGSRTQHGRKIAVSTDLKTLHQPEVHSPQGLSMWEFPLTLPIPEGYNPERDFYPPHKHEDYRWAMVVDLDKCIGCEACAAACYAENNVGVVGLERIIEQREMAWIWIERYQDPKDMKKFTFFPMLCQHCDNAPCESVCPVFAPHHSKEGLNNQIYNRCIGTRFCSQNCPYKARRFNWFDWKWPGPLYLQLNPKVTVRSKGVMEKCSFCVQRIKAAHGKAKNENRKIRDGEFQPACAQTCPTGVFTFGNLLDKESRVRKLTEESRAYQMMGYLNTKPAVIYMKKVLQEV
jgi:anaerobic selenocysteine-containing dehydrogenase/Fe-S-cluster-containing dehydrogenase component